MNAAVAPGELLARFIISSRWLRKQDQTVKPDAFIPPEQELSVTRHIGLTEEYIWTIGKSISDGMDRKLLGRADIGSGKVTEQGLSVIPHPVEGNPNHANITGWPLEKHEKKMLALELTKAAHFSPNPEMHT